MQMHKYRTSREGEKSATKAVLGGATQTFDLRETAGVEGGGHLVDPPFGTVTASLPLYAVRGREGQGRLERKVLEVTDKTERQ